jgi:hypothetical protein
MSNPNHPISPRRRPSPSSSSRCHAQLPAFCRTRSPRSVLMSVSSLRSTQRLLLLVLLFQLSTLLLLVAEAGPQHHLRPFPSHSSVLERDRQ